VDNFLRLENRHNGEILLMGRIRDGVGPDRPWPSMAPCRQEQAGRLRTCISRNKRKASWKQGLSALKSGRRRSSYRPGKIVLR